MNYICTNIYICGEAAKLHGAPGTPYKLPCRICKNTDMIPESTHRQFLQACPVCGQISRRRDISIGLIDLAPFYKRSDCRLCGCSFEAIHEIEDNNKSMFDFIIEFVRLLITNQHDEDLCIAIEQYCAAKEHGGINKFQSNVANFVINVMKDSAKRFHVYRRIKKCERMMECKILPSSFNITI